ncbi:hypothetical protein PVAP13_1NG555201 [Panicum virgatum]|uniref:Uncharacterized protein n=1 Tax=Panicum virgatum TaxID=38727 RepID=A0A8T0X7X4_PANVG|nr:hypothetical protein PVAP13_1NG555201 [Panicum virgatum]
MPAGAAPSSRCRRFQRCFSHHHSRRHHHHCHLPTPTSLPPRPTTRDPSPASPSSCSPCSASSPPPCSSSPTTSSSSAAASSGTTTAPPPMPPATVDGASLPPPAPAASQSPAVPHPQSHAGSSKPSSRHCRPSGTGRRPSSRMPLPLLILPPRPRASARCASVSLRTRRGSGCCPPASTSSTSTASTLGSRATPTARSAERPSHATTACFHHCIWISSRLLTRWPSRSSPPPSKVKKPRGHSRSKPARLWRLVNLQETPQQINRITAVTGGRAAIVHGVISISAARQMSASRRGGTEMFFP